MKELSGFKADYYRMTGECFQFKPRMMLFWLGMHNLRYVYWWRRAAAGSWLGRLQTLRYAKKYGIEGGKTAKIGKGLYLGHAYGITISGEAVLGDNVNIHKGATIGRTSRSETAGAPTIGSQVWIGVNATVVGKITVGNDVLIAPGAYVNFDVPDHSIVIGNPGTIHSAEYATRDYVNFLVK